MVGSSGFGQGIKEFKERFNVKYPSIALDIRRRGNEAVIEASDGDKYYQALKIDAWQRFADFPGLGDEDKNRFVQDIFNRLEPE